MVLKDRNMSTSTIIPTVPETTPEPSTQPETSAAVQRCLEAFNRVYRPLLAKGNYECIASRWTIGGGVASTRSECVGDVMVLPLTDKIRATAKRGGYTFPK
jgi:hypothetical protein